MRANHCGVDEVDFRLYVALLIRLCLHPLEELFPQPFLAPLIEAAVACLPWSIPLGQVTPWGACPRDPQNAVDDLAMILPRSPYLWFLRRQEQL